MDKPRLLRQITECEKLVGIPDADDKICENNVHNHVKSGEKGYIPLSHEKKMCRIYVDNSPIMNNKKQYEDKNKK